MPRSFFILHPSSSKRGFTLTELMISVALALLLLIGVNQVFKTTSQTVGTSYATLEGARKQLALDNTLNDDFSKAVAADEQPAIIIHSESLGQYWDKAEADNDKDGNVFTVDLDDDGLYTSAGEDAGFTGNGTGSADLRNGRVHRLDRVSFFARDVNHPFRRQTGDTPKLASDPRTLVSDETSAEAWIAYGFLRLPRDKPIGGGILYDPRLFNGTTGDYFEPAQGTFTQNPNNFYAKDWALGRQAILLRSQPDGDYLSLNNPSSGMAPKIPPLSPNSIAYSGVSPTPVEAINPATSSAWLAAHSRYDVAATTIRTLHKKAYPSSALVEIDGFTGISLGLDYVFNAKPWLDPAADRGNEFATTNPFLTRGCAQFIVEFAGDFMTQDNDPVSATYGDYKAKSGPDGILDFAVANGVRRTRWYGFPRDVAGVANSANPSGGPDGAIEIRRDVVPVRAVVGSVQPFEHFRELQSGVIKDFDWCGDGLGKNYLNQIRTDLQLTTAVRVPLGAQYICAWGPNELKTSVTATSTLPTVLGAITPDVPAYQVPGPWLIRVIINIRDPNGRLPDGQTIEHVYDLTRNSK